MRLAIHLIDMFDTVPVNYDRLMKEFRGWK